MRISLSKEKQKESKQQIGNKGPARTPAPEDAMIENHEATAT
jgi:hypothetical protein